MAPIETPAISGGSARHAWRSWWVPLALAAATLAAYHNTFSAPFVFDDIPAITRNPTIRDLRWSSELLAPGALGGSGAAGRPLVNLSLAVNHAVGGDDVRGYHALNLLIHLGAGLALFGVVRRTLRRSGCGFQPQKHQLNADATLTAFAIALLWLVHPLQTESVTCVIQRTESLMGLFFLLSFYCFARSIECHPLNDKGLERDLGRRNAGLAWAGACVAACALGALTKEVMAAAPLLVLAYDRTFVAGTWREAWRRRRWLHAALMSTWVLVALLVWRSQTRGGTVGFGHGVAWWEYALTQCRAVVMYLKLALWPHPLVLDYGTGFVRDAREVWPQAVLLVALMAGTAWALVRRPFDRARVDVAHRLQRRPAIGFFGAWFFVILAPSSSVVPLVTQTMAEHRMYLPLAAVVIAAVLALRAVAGRAALPICAAIAVAFGVATERRNADYRSAESIWADTAAKSPTNARARYALAELAAAAGRTADAIAHGEAAVKLQSRDAAARFNLAFDLSRAGRNEEALTHYREAARLRPNEASAHVNLSGVLFRLGRIEDAVAHAATVVRLQPESGENRFNLGQLLAHAGRTGEALPQLEAAVRLTPDFAEAHYRLGNVRTQLGRLAEAAAAYREAVRLAPAHFEARINLGGVLVQLGRAAEAVPVYEEALRLRPDDPLARANLARARELAGRR